VECFLRKAVIPAALMLSSPPGFFNLLKVARQCREALAKVKPGPDYVAESQPLRASESGSGRDDEFATAGCLQEVQGPGRAV